MKKRLFSIFLVLCFCLSLLPASVLAEEFGKTEEVVIFYTNDVHTYIDGQIRYCQIAALKASYENALLLDAGDHIQGTAYGSMDKGETIVRLMNAAGYDAATFGNHEFDYGMDGCLQAMDWAEYAYLSCNFYHEEDGVAGETMTQKYKIFEVDGVKIAVIGITTPESFTSSTPAYFQDEDGNYIYGFAGGEDGQALYDAVQAAIDEAGEQADYVIALGHLGVDGSSEPWRSVDVIANTTGLDAFIDGHSHTTVPMEEVEDMDGNTVILTQTGEYFGAVGKMTISDGKIKTELLTAEDLADIAPDEQVKAIEDQWIEEMEEKLGQKIGTADVTLDNYDANGNRLVRSQETNTGDFVTDALYYLFDSMGMDVDVAIMNGGGIRNKAVTGELTYKTCKEIHTFGNVACLQEVTGQQILDALEWGARGVGVEEHGAFLQVSGLTYEIDLSVENTTQVDEKGVWIAGPADRYRVHNVKIYDRETDSYQPLDLNETYKLAGYNYTLRNLGDGFAMFEGATNILDYVMEDYMVLANYIQGFENETVKANNSPLKESYPGMLIDYGSVSGSGRISFSGRLANTISYDVNGGEGNIEGSQIFGNFVTVATVRPSRENYFFTGWNTEPNGSGTNYSGGDTYYFFDEMDNGGCEQTLYAQWTQIYVGGVEVTENNASDVLGDGSVSYDPLTNTLTLKNANITTCKEYETGCVAGIYATGNLNLCVVGENTIFAPDTTCESIAICVMGSLEITGSGKLTAQGGKVSAVANSEDDDYAESIGIYVRNNLTIRQAHVVAISGSAFITADESWTGETYAYSDGMLVKGDLVVAENATLVATSSTASGVYAYSRGFKVSGNATISDSVVIASGGFADGTDSARSFGILIVKDVEVQNATITAVGGAAGRMDSSAPAASYASSTGMQVQGTLSVLEGGMIDATGGKATGLQCSSSGMDLFGDYLIIDSGTVKATGGEVTGSTMAENETDEAWSTGVYSKIGELYISGLGSLTAIGNRAEGSEAYSYGINIGGGISVYDGYLTAVSGDATGKDYAVCFGVYLYQDTFYVYDNAAVVNIRSGHAKSEQKAYSNALYVGKGDVGFLGGTITITGGSWEGEKGDCYAVYVTAQKWEEDGVSGTSGGYVNIACDDITIKTTGAGLMATNVTITSNEAGSAIYAECGIEIGEEMAVTLPENGQVSGQGEQDPQTEWYAYYTVVDDNGEAAQNLTVELHTYKVRVERNTSSTLAMNVPAGWSVNGTYCETFGIEDMAQALHGKKDGFAFVGFYTDEACTDGNEYDFDAPVTEDITIYAKWIAVYIPTVEATDGGETTVDGQDVRAGDTVTITAKPEQGKEVATVTVTDENGNAVAVTANEDGTYSFVQPDSNVTVKVIYQEKKNENQPSEDDNKPTEPTNPTEPSGTEEPEKGSSAVWSVLIIVCGAGIGVAVYFVKKRKK